MAHYAFITNGIVTEVITGIDETETIQGLDTETWYGNFYSQTCKRTSYNGNIRFNYAGVGYTYDEGRDAFIAPKLYPSWVLDEIALQWQAPIAMPKDDKMYFWNEESLNWVEHFTPRLADDK